MANLVETMMRGKPRDDTESFKNSLREVIQEITLYGLSVNGFFNDASFYGGTALRLFYGLGRYSEDLDFSLKTPMQGFDFEKYAGALPATFESIGFDATVSVKTKTFRSKMESAFVKGNTRTLMLEVDSLLDVGDVYPTDSVKVKIEIDTDPPGGAGFEKRFIQLPFPAEVSVFDQGSLFAGKVHAILCRNWGHRFKGRDLYDFLFYVSRGIHLNVESLRRRLVQSGVLRDGDELDLSTVRNMLLRKFDEIDFEDALEDVNGFVHDLRSLNSWSRELFVDALTRMQ